jgi:hypothetical protein
MASPTSFVIDACSSLNLFATDRPVDLAKAANIAFLVLPEVEAEAKYLFGSPDEKGVRPQESIDWPSLLASGVAVTHPFPDEALPALITFASQLTDVDAKCVALAIHRGVGLLSDDGKVRKVFQGASRAACRSTVSVIRAAATSRSLDKPAVRNLFERIRMRACFEPSKRDPDYAWYLEMVV